MTHRVARSRNELLQIQISNTQLTSSLPGLTRQSIAFQKILSKIDGCPGQAPGMTNV
jgi:hypothetical protein